MSITTTRRSYKGKILAKDLAIIVQDVYGLDKEPEDFFCSLNVFRNIISPAMRVHRQALLHAFLIARKVEGYTLGEISQYMGGTRKGNLSQYISEMTAMLADKLHPDLSQKHQAILDKIAELKDIEDAFTGEDMPLPPDTGTEEPTALPDAATIAAPPAVEEVRNPLFEPVVAQEKKKIPDLSGLSSGLDDDFPMLNDGVPAPDTKGLGKSSPMSAPDAPPEADNPTEEQLPPSGNLADFLIGLSNMLLPQAGKYATKMDTEEIQYLEDRGKLKTGATKRVEKQNEQNAKQFEREVKTQLSHVRTPLARVTAANGATINPYSELVITALVALGMLAISIINMRSTNAQLLNQLRRDITKD